MLKIRTRGRDNDLLGFARLVDGTLATVGVLSGVSKIEQRGFPLAQG